jgi:hypothetical protein
MAREMFAPHQPGGNKTGGRACISNVSPRHRGAGAIRTQTSEGKRPSRAAPLPVACREGGFCVVYLRGPAGAPVPRRGAGRAGRVLALGAGALLLAACGAEALPPTPSPAPQGLAPLEAAAPPAPAAFPLAAGDWPMYGHDPARTNDNPDETLLRPDNVAALAPDWQAAIGMGPAPASAAPSVAGGRV